MGIQDLAKDEYDHAYEDEVYLDTDLVDALIEVKVSIDGGVTWSRRRINLGGDIDESGLKVGEVFQINGEKYKVLEGDFGLCIELSNKPSKTKVNK
ncbi:MAG TPA: hypothetical protein DEF42_03540 [Desulfosporosinus sp.]|nr:hypothetical protein [Desulfosporosinus sp.]